MPAVIAWSSSELWLTAIGTAMFSGSNQTDSKGSERTAAMPPNDAIGDRVRRAGVAGIGQAGSDPQRCSVHEPEVQGIAVGEVPVQRGSRAAGNAGDVDHRCAGHADLGERPTGGVEQVVHRAPSRPNVDASARETQSVVCLMVNSTGNDLIRSTSLGPTPR